MLSVNNSKPLGPIKQNATGPCPESLHSSTPLESYPVRVQGAHKNSFFGTDFKIILPPTLGAHKWSFDLRFPTQKFVYVSRLFD
jgi:hypothetical protein